MKSRLNPDGAKIRALRIQRGWTQEQLAEIAGVSARTVQRAETAGSAAFDTLRAVAGAFETDFNQLLRTDPCQIPEPEPSSVPPPEQVAAPIRESCEKVALSRPAQPVPRKWTTFPIVATALAAGLLAGGILVYRFHPLVEVNSSTPRPNPANAGRAETSKGPSHMDLNTVGIPMEVPTGSGAITVSTISNREPDRVVEKPGYQHPVAAEEVIQAADLGPHATMTEPTQSAFFELPLPRNLPPILATAEMPGAWNPGLAYSGDLGQKDQAVGAVRQSIGQAAKKTSDAIAKVSASIRRVF